MIAAGGEAHVAGMRAAVRVVCRWQRTTLRDRSKSASLASVFERLRTDLFMAVRPFAPCTLAGLQYNLSVMREADVILNITGTASHTAEHGREESCR